MYRSILTALGCFALAAAFSLVPIGPQDASLTLSAKTAFAQPGGKGKGNDKDKGHGRGSTKSIQGVANGHSGQKSANGRALGHEIDGMSGVGHATAPGQAKKAGYKGMYDKSELKGAFNAINASARAFEVSNPQSRVQQVKDYLDAVQELSELEDTDPGLEAAITAAAEEAAEASSRPVTEAMLDEVNAISNEKDLTDPAIELDNARTDEVAEEARDIQGVQ